MSAPKSSPQRPDPRIRGRGVPPRRTSIADEATSAGFDEREREDLLEFLAPIEPGPLADPIFKARLRLDLWWLLQCQREAGRRRTDRR